MRIRWTTGIVMATGVLTLIAGVAAGGGTAHAVSTAAAPAAAAPQGTHYVTAGTAAGQLSAVAAASTSSAWAVGVSNLLTPKTLILHWNGKSWT